VENILTSNMVSLNGICHTGRDWRPEKFDM